MKKNFSNLTLVLTTVGLFSAVNAQVFTETMGNAASSGTAIATYEAANNFDNDNLTMTGTGDIRNTSASSGYTGASGQGNVFLAANSAKTFQIAGINTTGLSNYVVNFGVVKSTSAANGSELAMEYSTDGINYTAMSFPALPTGGGTAVWTYRSTTTILPETANLRIRWTNNSGNAQYRLDDISIGLSLVCTPPTVTISSSVPNATLCASGGNAATTLTANLSGGSGSWSYQWKFWNGSTFTSISGGTNASQNASPTNTLDYQVVVTSTTNSQCTASATQTVTVVADPTLSVSSSNVSCFGGNNGAASVILSGGVSPSYTYSWSNGAGNTTSTSGLAAGTYTVSASGTYGCNATASVTITEPTQLVASSTSGTILCNGGTTDVTVSATGGTGAYVGTGTYTVGAGTYSYTVTDANGCSASTDITVTEPTALAVSFTNSDYNGFNISCFDGSNGSITANVSGGVQAYAYSWNTGSTADAISGLTAGSYDVTATDANGCQVSGSTTLFEPTKLEIDATSTAILCNGDSSTVVVTTSGGVSPYSVNDAGTYTVPAGSYTYNVVDLNGCTNSIDLDITQPTLLTINAGGDEVVYIGYGPMTCANLDADVQGGTPAYNVMWTSLYSGGGMGETLTACPTQNDVFTVTVVDANGCTTSDELSICVVDVICYAGNSGNQKVEMCQVPPGNPGNAHTICVDANAVPAHLAIGCYLGACNEAATVCAAVSSKPVVAMTSTDAKAALSVYPNPTENTTTVSLTMSKAGEYAVELYNMMGQKVTTIYTGTFGEYENQTFEMNMRSLENGIYMVGVSNGGRIIETIKVVKN